MKLITRMLRLARINLVLMRYNLGELVLGGYWFAPLQLLVYLNPYHWTQRNKFTRGERIRLAIEELGPIFVKAGQIASTRRDLIPDDIANELALLQDRVPPFCGREAKAIIEKSLGTPLDNIFSYFETNALASASIAQVHSATLINGQSVVVKVLRPNISEIIAGDIDLLMTIATLAEKYSKRARAFKPKQMVKEIAQTLIDELDLMREASNATQLKRNFKSSKLLYIPTIHWAYTRTNVLVMERIYGTPIHDLEGLRRAGVDMKKLAERGLEVFFTQVFRDSFFHADLHPGNIFVSTENPSDPTYIAVDFGIVGSLSQSDQRYIAENMIAFFKRDYQRVAELHIACGWLSPDTRVDQFEGAIRAVSEPIFEQPLSEISFGQLLLRLFQVARQFQINIQPQLILLQKTLLSIEGLSRQIAPDLDIWSTASPQIEKWLKKQVGVGAFFRRIRNNLPMWSEQLPEMPSLIYEVLKETKLQQETDRFNRMNAVVTVKQRPSSLIKLAYFAAGSIVTGLVLCMIGKI